MDVNFTNEGRMVISAIEGDTDGCVADFSSEQQASLLNISFHMVRMLR